VAAGTSMQSKLDNLQSSPEDTDTGEMQIQPEKSNPDIANVDRTYHQPQQQVKKPDAGSMQFPAGQRPTPEENKPTLPEAYRRAAIHQQWSPEDIDMFFDADPIKALKTFAKIHESNNNLSRQFSEFGTMRQQLRVEQEAAAANAREQVIVQPATHTPQPAVNIDLAGLEKEYGDDKIVGVVKQLANKVNELSQQAQPVVRQPQSTYVPQTVYQPAVSQYSNGLLREVNDFFRSAELKSYTDFYGDGDIYDALTPGEFANRHQVAHIAGTILAGSELKGERMPVRMALERAHMVVSQPYMEKAIASKLTEQLVTRSSNITVRPGSRFNINDPAQGKPNDRQEVERRAGERMRQIGL